MEQLRNFTFKLAIPTNQTLCSANATNLTSSTNSNLFPNCTDNLTVKSTPNHPILTPNMDAKTAIDALFWMKTVSMVLGIIFNILVIVVRGNKFVRQRRISSYHFIILQIALADLIYACLLSFEVEKHLNNFVWVHSLAACRIVYPLSAMSAGVPILLMLLLAIERYLGVINALTHKLRTRSILLVGIFIWVFSFIVILPILFSLKIHDQFGACTEEMDPLLDKVVTIFYLVVFMLIPLLLSTLFHCHIYHFVRRHTKKMSMHVQSKTPPGQLNNNRLEGNTSVASLITKTSSVAGDCDTYLVTEKMQLSNKPSSVGSTCDENEELCPQSKKSVLKIGGKTIRKICHSGTTMCYKVRHRLTGIRHQRKEKTRRLKYKFCWQSLSVSLLSIYQHISGTLVIFTSNSPFKQEST
uniref:G-protein coupled receptors family 1 profile domain-containing protein n=2 Tax=Clytia hemisphaerica TaxID=252671 RepID=A0A7M6DQU5_9CNID